MSKKKKKLKVVQVGQTNWAAICDVPENLDWIYLRPEEMAAFVDDYRAREKAYKDEQKLLQELSEQGEKRLPKPRHKPPVQYAALVLTDEDYPEDLVEFADLFDVYTIFYDEQHVPHSEWTKAVLYRKMAHMTNLSHPQDTMTELRICLFNGQYGAKIPVGTLRVTSNYQGSVSYDGYSFLKLDGFYGEDFQQIAHFHYNIAQYAYQSQNLFFEHICGEGVETKIVVQFIPSGAVSHISQEWEFEGNQTKEQMTIDTTEDGMLAVSMYARGQGKLDLGPCHSRFGRHQFGEFILGGQRLVDNEQQELMYYFDPQDFKPPLCVYFSGFRTAEGFEGYWMMKHMKTPFMLICDPRLEGGSFYMGSPELEKAVSDVIQEKLDFLGFDNSQLILSGLSMGTFGATYYGTKLAPHAIVIGKPVFSLGEVALKERIKRPAGFPTSLDILRRHAGGLDEEAAHALDNRFWNQFEQGDFSKTTFVVAYMKDDDYDSTAFSKMVEKTKYSTATVIGRGWSGRHGDGGSGPTMWFLRQYYNILKDDFGRKY